MVTLAPADMEHLDQLALDVRRRHGTHINRGEIVRALIAASLGASVISIPLSRRAAIRAIVTARLRA
jgi:hypothetical protein